MAEVHTCGCCGARSLSLKGCTCGRIHYCDKSCQTGHWKTHKKTCGAAKSNVSGAPIPLSECFNWPVYNRLRGTSASPSFHEVLAKKALSWPELGQFEFFDTADACLALFRAKATCDTNRENNHLLYFSACYMLMARALMYLARDAQFHCGDSNLPRQAFLKELRACPTQAALFEYAIQKSIDCKAAKAISLSFIAQGLAEQAEKYLQEHIYLIDQRRATNMLAECALLLAEGEVMLAEMHAAIARDTCEIGWRPEGFNGPWNSSEQEMAWMLLAGESESLRWIVSVPGYQYDDLTKSYLAQYWFGQSKATAIPILTKHFPKALQIRAATRRPM